MYQTLYRTYRPSTFDQVIGQDHVVKLLLAALKKKKVAHAYLFTGPRGTGKTTVGRLLAKAVNCLEPTAEQPICDRCDSCQAIAAGRSLDVVEIDAASNRGIDDIRALRERIQFPPQERLKKIYIIDEVHMLTAEAFNALLKTLEEPPEHALFVLATTEPQKVPITIQSRCQRLDFHRGTPADLVKNLEQVSQKEGIKVEPAALNLIAELAEGGYRDSLTLLERLLSEEKEVDVERVRELFGLGDEQTVRELIAALIEGDRPRALAVLDTADTKGVHAPYLAQSVVLALRRRLYLQVGAIKTTDKEEATQAARLTLEEWRELLENWLAALVDSKKSPLPMLALEIAVAKGQPQITNQVIDEQKISPAAEIPTAPIVISVPAAEPKTAEPKTASPQTAQPPTANQAPDNSPAEPVLVIDPKQWDEVLAILIKYNHSLTKLLQQAAVGRIVGDKLAIAVQYPFHVETLRQKANFEAIAKALEQVLRRTVVPEFVVNDGRGNSQPAPAPADDKMLDDIQEIFS